MARPLRRSAPKGSGQMPKADENGERSDEPPKIEARISGPTASTKAKQSPREYDGYYRSPVSETRPSEDQPRDNDGSRRRSDCSPTAPKSLARERARLASAVAIPRFCEPQFVEKA